MQQQLFSSGVWLWVLAAFVIACYASGSRGRRTHAPHLLEMCYLPSKHRRCHHGSNN